jgi:alpha-tubulin suppressor-like RCC1 family protein
VELRLSTDVKCADHPATSIAVSRSSTATAEPATITTACQADGTIGTLVILPASSKDETLQLKVVTSIGGPVETTCVAPDYGPTCIVSRRQLAFVPHEELVLPVAQEIDCAGVGCGESQTCRKGSCVSATVDLDHCKTSPEDCGQELGPPGGPGGQGGDGGAAGEAGGGGAGGAGMGGAGMGGAGMGGAGMGGAGMGGAGMGGAGMGGAGMGGAGMGGMGGAGGSGPLVVTALFTGANRTCARFDSGKIKCWGRDNMGQLGLGDTIKRGDGAGEMGDKLPFVDLGAGTQVTGLAVGEFHTCALIDAGQVKCWGANESGQLGLGDQSNRGDKAGQMGEALPLVSLPAATVSELAAGNQHTCARFSSGKLACWGANGSGQLGLGDTSNRGDQPGEMGDSLPLVDLGAGLMITHLATGSAHTCALLDTGQVKCWGSNKMGQLGLGDTLDRGTMPGQMGDALPFVDLGTGQKATALAVGLAHSCALLDSGLVKCWGANDQGQLGLGDTTPRGDKAGQMGDALPALDLGAGVLSLRSGASHQCALLDGGQAKCWGANAQGQLGLGDKNNRGDGPSEMATKLPAVALGADALLQIDAGQDHSGALFASGRVKCWGNNFSGELGLGDTVVRGDNAGEMGDNLPFVDLGTMP